MAHVQRSEDGDSVVLKWGDTGRERAVRPGDVRAAAEAFTECVAEGVSRGDAVDGVVERALAEGLSRRVGVRKDAGNGLYVAWFPFDGDGDDDDKLAQELSDLGKGAVKPEDIHLTLLYLGPADAWDVDMVTALTKIETTRWQPLEGAVVGLGRFVVSDTQDAVVALVDCKGLNDFRRCLGEQLYCYGACKDYAAADAAQVHGYVPHLTLGYVPKTQASPPPLTEVLPFCLHDVSVCTPGSKQTFNLLDYAQDAAGHDMSAFAAARVALGDAQAVTKAGRVLSGKNLEALRAAHAAMGKVIDAEVSRQGKAPVGDPDASHSLGGSAHQANVQGEGEDGDTAGDQEGGTPGGAAVVYSRDRGEGEGLAYVVTKASAEKSFTFGPLYAPDRKDAHGEWTDADTLQGAVWDYVQACVDRGDNRLNIQHDTDGAGAKAAGRWVEVCAWPYETAVKLRVPGEDEREVQLPAGTVFMGVKWEPEVYKAVKAGKIAGLSLGGRAVRVAEGENLEPMGDKLS